MTPDLTVIKAGTGVLTKSADGTLDRAALVHLVSAIAALPEPYREVLVLRDIDELTAPETAERLNISIDAVKSRLHRARTMMRERLLSSGYLASASQEA